MGALGMGCGNSLFCPDPCLHPAPHAFLGCYLLAPTCRSGCQLDSSVQQSLPTPSPRPLFQRPHWVPGQGCGFEHKHPVEMAPPPLIQFP